MNAPAPSSPRAARRASQRTSPRAEVPPIPPLWVGGAMRAVTRFAVKQMLKAEHVGREHVPARGPGIVISNHPTYLDPWMVAYGTRRWITWMTWDEVFEWPLVGPVVRRMGAFPVNLDAPAPSTFKAALAVLAAGRLLGVFFEGGRTKVEHEPWISPPRRGAARLALKADVPVIPVSIAGARRLWPHASPLPRTSGRVVVRYHPPVLPAQVAPRGASLRAREGRLTDAIAGAIRQGLA